jgi:molybdate transport system substrate-binding protein
MRKVGMKLFLTLLCLILLRASALAGEIYLSVAASLKDVINELSDGFAKQNAGIKFLKNYGSSGALARQIENGAPVDIFISANLEWMDYLQNKGLMDSASVRIFAYNTLVFVGAPDRKVGRMQDLLKLEKIAIGSPKSVPAGEYAWVAIKKAGIDKPLERKLVMAKDVRECLMYAERGEVDGAFVYKTDAIQAKRAKILFAVPENLYPRVTYSMGLTLTERKNRDAESFYKHLQGEGARAVLEKYGFLRK